MIIFAGNFEIIKCIRHLIHRYTILQHSHSSRYQVEGTTPKQMQKASCGSCFSWIYQPTYPLWKCIINQSYPSQHICKRKWCWMSICFAQEWLTGFWVRAMQPWLSAKVIVTDTWGNLSPPAMSSIRQFPLWHLNATYSTFTHDVVILTGAVTAQQIYHC